jgi:hypothetical protein
MEVLLPGRALAGGLNRKPKLRLTPNQGVHWEEGFVLFVGLGVEPNPGNSSVGSFLRGRGRLSMGRGVG